MSKAWVVLSESVRGASHVRSGAPNQDAVRVDVPPSSRRAALLAVADGHGSPRCFRSDQGSRMAVDVAIRMTRLFLDDLVGMPTAGQKKEIEHRLPSLLVREWRKEVEQHWRQTPLEIQERAALGLTPDAPAPVDAPFIAYGATLVMAAVSDQYVFFLQLGDGEILEVSGEPPQTCAPMPIDPSLIANETTSLCQKEAARLFRFSFRTLQGGRPSLLLVCTDGYSNAFASRDGFHQVGTDFLRLSREMKTKALARSLQGWLGESSSSGSGDDVSVAMLIRRHRTKTTQAKQ